MPISVLQIAALISYLVSWLAFVIVAILGIRVRVDTSASPPAPIRASVIVGTFLQWASFMVIMRSLPAGPLRPSPIESTAALVLAPLAVLLFLWAARFSERPTNAKRNVAAPAKALVTTGAYSYLRNPIYLAFLMMLAATACIASAGLNTLAAVMLYLTGSEIRIASEEADLLARYPDDYPAYQRRTRWRYLPGLR